MLIKRILTAIWGVPLIIVSVWFSGPEYSFPFFTVVVALWGLLAAWEFYRLTGVSRSRPLLVCGLVFTLLFIFCPLVDLADVPEVPVLLTGTIILSLALLVFLPEKKELFNTWTWMLGGVLYIGWLLSLPVAVRLQPDPGVVQHVGRNLVFLLMFATFGSDTMAYFIGRAFGRHKMAPGISPGKTWEGAAAGLVGAVVVSLLFTLNAPWGLPLGYGEAIIIGLFVSIFGQIGDLAESMLKRSTGAKESGNLLPGHGGLLDRLDSVVFAGAVVYSYYWLVLA